MGLQDDSLDSLCGLHGFQKRPMTIMPATSHKMMPTKPAKRQPHEANAQRVLLAKTEQKKLTEDQPCECITNATAVVRFFYSAYCGASRI